MSEAFGAARTLSAPTQHVKSEEVDRRTSEPLDSLIGCVPAEWLLCSRQHVEAVCFNATLCRTGQTRGNGVVGEWSDKAIGSLGGVWGAFRSMSVLAGVTKILHDNWFLAFVVTSSVILHGVASWQLKVTLARN